MSVSQLLKPNDLDVYANELNANKINSSGDINISGADGTLLYIQNNKLNPLGIGSQDEVLKVNNGKPEWGAGGGGNEPAIALATSTGSVSVNTSSPSTPGDLLTFVAPGVCQWGPQQPATTSLNQAYLNGNEITQLEDLSIKNTKNILLPGSNRSIFENVLEIDGISTSANTNVSITNDVYKAPLNTKFQKESVHKNYMNTYGGTGQAELDCITIDGSADYPEGTLKNGLWIYEGINPLTQVYNTEDFLLGNEFYKNGDLLNGFSMLTASTVPIFENDGDSIEILSNDKINGLVIRLALLADPVMGYDVQFWNGSSYDNTNYGGTFSNFANFEGTIQWNLRNDEIKDWQTQTVGIGDYYVIRLKRNDGVNPPPTILPRLGDVVGIKQLSSNINYWASDGQIKTKEIKLGETITIGENYGSNFYSLPTELIGIGGAPLAPRSNFIMITNSNGTMSFKQSPYLYSSSAQLIDVPIPDINAKAIINTGVNINGENGSLTVPAGAFSAGQSYRLEMGGVVNFTGTQNITVFLEAVSGIPPQPQVITEIGNIQFGAEAAGAGTNPAKPWRLNSNFHIREISGVNAVVSAVFDFGYQPDQNNAPYAVFGSAVQASNVVYTENQRLQVRINSSNPNGSTISTYVMSVSKKF